MIRVQRRFLSNLKVFYKVFNPLVLYDILYIFFQTHLSAFKNEDALDAHDNHLLM